MIDGETASCTIAPTGLATDRGKVGLSNGGGFLQQLACDGSDKIVGIAIDLSDGLADGVTRSARGIQIACAQVTIDGAGGHVGVVRTKQISGNGGSGWSPATLSPIARCPDDAVVSGLAVHGSPNVNYFLDATMQCSKFDNAGNFAGTSLVAIAGSGTDNTNPSSAECQNGEQVTQLTGNTGAGLDSVRLQCRQTICQ